MKCRVIRAYGQWSVGHVFTEMPGNVARTLIARNLVEEVVTPADEQKQFASPADRMMRGGVKKQAGQRR